MLGVVIIVFILVWPQVEASEEGVMTLMARVTDNIVLPPDPFSSLPMMLPAGEVQRPHELKVQPVCMLCV